MLFFPQCNFRAIFSFALCIPPICSLAVIAHGETPPVTAPSSHIARSQLACVTASLQLGDVAVGQTSSKLATITNIGPAALKVLSVTLSGTEFALNGVELPLTLAAGESFTFPVTFAPQEIGPAHGAISIISGSFGQTSQIQLAGTGRAHGRLQVTPAIIDFGDGSVGSTRTQTGQLTASGASVVVSSARIGGEGFQLTGLSFPVTIPAGRSVTFTVTNISPDRRSSSAILSFASDADNSASEQTVTVRIAKPAQHKVQLSWRASTSKHVVGYNVYRGSQSGGPYKKINGALDTGTRFTDLKVMTKHKYYYVATAVNSRNRESVHSKQIQVVIP
jgi:hypothetical protein